MSTAPVDTVQFTCPEWFAEESEALVKVEVTRLGSFQGEASVRFSTEDVSGETYFSRRRIHQVD